MTEREQIGDWTLLRLLGEGGNARVWAALRNASEGELALKVLKTRKAQREPYKRFVREIDFLRSIGPFPGVLPLVDAYLPEDPRSNEATWLAMPIATPIEEALEGESLRVVVEAISGIARTLARLQAEHGVAHRDLKPSNLYRHQGDWVVGDFGLVAIPDLESLTRTGAPLGPAHFTADEMILDANTADPHAADVFSLAKTLWVLAVGQRFPPAGHQRAEEKPISIAELRPYPHAHALDRLIDVMTSRAPQDRPSMERVADDLQAWLSLGGEPTALDVTEVRERLRRRMEQEWNAKDQEEQNKELAYAAVRRLQELTAPLNDALRAVHPRPEIDVTDDQFTTNMLRTPAFMGGPDVIFSWQRCSRLAAGPDHNRYVLRLGRSLELIADGVLIFRSMVYVGHESMGGGDFSWQDPGRRAAVGSVEAERMLSDGIADLAEQLRTGLDAFAERVPGGP